MKQNKALSDMCSTMTGNVWSFLNVCVGLTLPDKRAGWTTNKRRSLIAFHYGVDNIIIS